MDPVLFVDVSYYVFYRFYALVSWYKLSQDREIVIDTLHTDITFLEKFKKLCKENLLKIIKQKGCRPDQVLLAADCSRGTIWRMKLFSEYKANRDTTNRKFNSYMFTYMYNEIIPELIQQYKMRLITIDEAEADDIIAVLKSRIRREFPELPIYIMTNDRDYIQLFDDYTQIFNLQGKQLIPTVSPEIDLQWKILLGDPSDNIPSVFYKVTKKKLQLYIDDPQLLHRELDINRVACDRYNRNKSLIDMKQIPTYISEKMDSTWTEVLNLLKGDTSI